MYEYLAKYTTLGIGGLADVAVITSESQLDGIRPSLVIGRGSKLLVSSRGTSGKVIVMRTSGVIVSGNEIVADSGVTLPTLVRIAKQHNLSGLEWACGIPASVGGAVMMNAGAYGGSMDEVVSGVTVHGVGEIPRSDIDMSYRSTRGIDGIITKVRLKLQPEYDNMILSRLGECDMMRDACQPRGKSAGSSFKAVDGKSAGYYLEQVGMKGVSHGGAIVSDRHANFILNSGGASSADVRYLLDVGKLKVLRKFKIRLEEEIIYIGEF